MKFSLQRRFLLLLLLPVALILTLVGIAGFVLVRDHLLDQWIATTNLRLEKAALAIQNRLDDKLNLINLIAKTERIPRKNLAQAFLLQQLIDKEGIKFVDLVEIPGGEPGSKKASAAMNRRSNSLVEGLYTMELCEDVEFCAPTLDPNSLDRSLTVVKTLAGSAEKPKRQLLVRISFESFLDAVTQSEEWVGSTFLLVTSTGQFLASTDKAMADRRKLGENGNGLEKRLLAGIRTKLFGTVWGDGYPPSEVAGFYKVPDINWYVIQCAQGRDILAPMVQFRFLYTVVAIIAIAAILLLIRSTTKPVARSISEVAEAAARVKSGDYKVTLPEARSDEIGQLSHSFNEMIAGLKQRDLIERTFGRYVDRNVADELMKRPDSLRLGGEKRIVTIMMADLRNFTSVSERLTPEQVIAIINRYFSRMINVIERYRGIIVDFYGDAVLVFFNGMQADVKSRAADAVKCALEMQREQEGFAGENVADGLPELQMGIGIHTGEVIVGNIGTESRAKYGIVGSDVNLTARIQGVAGGGKVVVSQETVETLGNWITVSGDFRVCLKGVKKDRELYEVESIDWEGPTEFCPLD